MKKSLALVAVAVATFVLSSCALHDPGRNGQNVMQSNSQSSDDSTINFAFDSATLTTESKTKLDQIVKQDNSQPVDLSGYADERGTMAYNLALGKRRADAVKAYLVSKGVPAGQITEHSYGSANPVVAGHDEQSWSMNRRVEIALG